MKKIIQLTTAMLFITIAFNANAQSENKFKTTTFECNIDCHSCQKKVMTHIPYEKGVKDVKVDLAKKQVTVKFKKNKNTEEELIKAFKKIGFTAVVKKEKNTKKEKPVKGENSIKKE